MEDPGTAPTVLAGSDDLTGKTIGRFQITTLLGKGGMGEVYLAEDSLLKRSVALKRVSASLRSNPHYRELLLKEAERASRLNDEHVAQIHDVVKHESEILLVMEYVDGQSLRQRTGETLPLSEFLSIAVQCAEALVAAHQSGIVHRDIKPENIMLTTKGKVKICDFGIARQSEWIEDTKSLDRTPTVDFRGTPAYMAPEALLNRDPDFRADMFSLGIVLYEILTGKHPFRETNNQVATVDRIIHAVHMPAAQANSAVPKAVSTIVDRMLCKDPSARYSSPAELLSALKSVQIGATVPLPKFRRASINAMAADLNSVLSEIRSKSQTNAWKLRSPWVAAIALAAVTGLLAVAQLPFVRNVFSRDRASTALPASTFDLVKQGRTYLRRYDQPGNIDRAISSFQNAIQQDSNSAPAHAGLGEAYFRKDAVTPDPQWKRLAADSARKSVELNSDLAISHLALGMVLLRIGKADEAEPELQRALRLDPLNGIACVWLGEYFVEKKDARAEEFYNKAKQLSPDDWNAHYHLGRFLYRNSKYEKAADAWEQANKVAPDNILVLRSLAAAYHALDRNDEVLAVLQRALEIAPSATAYNNMGTSRFFGGQYAEAAAAFEKAVELNPTEYLYWGNLADAHRWIPGNEGKAKQAYQRAIQLGQEKRASMKDDLELLGRLSIYFAKIGDKKNAVDQLGRIENIPGRTAGSYFKSLIAYEITGDRERAIRDLNKALRLGYPLKEISNEPELTSLRKDRRYHNVVVQPFGK